jgi:hypothetical protein
VVVLGVAALALGLGFMSHGTARAQTPTPTATPITITVDTQAEVPTGTGVAPVVEAKWELPDMQPTVTGFQYYAASGPTDLNDNDIPDADDDPLTPLMQMYPNLCDDPNDPATQRAVQYWAIASDETATADILSMFDKVWQPGLDAGEAKCPDGAAPDPVTGYCFKYQVDLAFVTCDAIGTFDDTVYPSVVTLSEAMLAAIDTSQITKADAEALVIDCTKGENRVAMAQETIATHEPHGIYNVTAYALDHASNEGSLDNTFEVLPILGLHIDFSLVDWGTIAAGVHDVVSGDENLTTPAAPTVKDCGNIKMAIGLKYSEMVQQGVPGPKKITTFDATLLGTTLTFLAGDTHYFPACLIPCHPKQLDLSIDPPSDTPLPQGIYKGTLDVMGVACPTGD